MSATGDRSQGGFTLIEMLVVIAILGLITGLVFPSWVGGPMRRVALYHARAALASNLRLARADAVRGGQSVTVELSDDGRGYVWAGSRVVLPPAIGIAGEPRSIGFFPDGSSSGGALTVADPARRLVVTVDPATGVVASP